MKKREMREMMQYKKPTFKMMMRALRRLTMLMVREILVRLVYIWKHLERNQGWTKTKGWFSLGRNKWMLAGIAVVLVTLEGFLTPNLRSDGGHIGTAFAAAQSSSVPFGTWLVLIGLPFLLLSRAVNQDKGREEMLRCLFGICLLAFGTTLASWFHFIPVLATGHWADLGGVIGLSLGLLFVVDFGGAACDGTEILGKFLYRNWKVPLAFSICIYNALLFGIDYLLIPEIKAWESFRIFLGVLGLHTLLHLIFKKKIHELEKEGHKITAAHNFYLDPTEDEEEGFTYFYEANLGNKVIGNDECGNAALAYAYEAKDNNSVIGHQVCSLGSMEKCKDTPREQGEAEYLDVMLDMAPA